VFRLDGDATVEAAGEALERFESDGDKQKRSLGLAGNPANGLGRQLATVPRSSPTMSVILGLNAYHGDSSACLVRDGHLVAAAEEERFCRIKHWAGFPSEAIRYCLEAAGIELSAVEHIAINRNPRVNNFRRLAYVLKRRPAFRLVLNRLRNITKAAAMDRAFRAAFPGTAIKARLHQIEHHFAHLASAFLVSPFREAVCLSVDGFGDFASAAWGMGRGRNIDIDGRIFFPHSLGIFYSAITQFVGFPHFGDEYKVMGLAPYGKPAFIEEMRHIVEIQSDGTFRLNLKLFRHHNENVAYTWNDCSPEIGVLFKPMLEQLLGPARRDGEELKQRHKDIARSAQAMYEEAFFHLLRALYHRYQCPRLALAGGCAMNSVANGKIYRHSPFRKLYLPAAAGDAGGAIGAAFAVSHELSSSDLHFQMDHAYWGPSAQPAEIQQLLETHKGDLEKARCRVEHFNDTDALCARTAAAISEGKVIGWFQGRMEWGPRALGNRSIVCDPRRGDMKEILNLKIKRRESFRPFAPSIQREAVAEWFETDDDIPFMMEVFQVRPEKRALIPAVTHVDGSGRLHTVTRAANPRYHSLIEAFRKITGVPLVLNTSFNENEPVVCRPGEALDCFLRTRMDVLVLGDCYIERNAVPSSISRTV
jgi:carbamoyltransferase